MRIVLNGTWKDNDAAAGSRAINYWWGLSAGVVDLICSQDLPKSTKRLTNLLRNNICSETLVPFYGEIAAQDIITMDWLVDNVEGSIPAIAELTPEAQSVVRMQGVNKEQADV